MRSDAKGRELFDQRADAARFARALEEHCNWFSGVPDSVFRRALTSLRNWHFAPRENHAVGMAFGATIGGARACIVIQNSGLGMCIDALLGTFDLYRQGLLLVVANRGVLPWEEVQHRRWGQITKALLDAIGIESISFDAEGVSGIERAARGAFDGARVVSLLVERGNIDE